ncbi:hypothetical protein DIPPA_10861 [Diplonema papillatum]|nr:hypothetical protein DIPPA_10861 [Diplonema papillatum]|eukprot:gene952-1449_t
MVLTPLVLELETVRIGLWCTAALAVNQFYIQAKQGRAKFPAGVRAPEDVSLFTNRTKQPQDFGEGPADEKMKKARMLVTRWNKISENSLQNVPFGLLVAWSSMLTASGNPLFKYFFIAFAVSRWAHTLFYAAGSMPGRPIAWISGWMSVIAMLTLGLTN